MPCFQRSFILEVGVLLHGRTLVPVTPEHELPCLGLAKPLKALAEDTVGDGVDREVGSQERVLGWDQNQSDVGAEGDICGRECVASEESRADGGVSEPLLRLLDQPFDLGP